MNRTLHAVAALALLTPFAVGCASRTAPFDTMDKAQITVLRLQGVEQPPQAAPAAPQPANPLGLPAIPIPGLSPEQQAQLQAAGNQILNGLPPGLIPPGLIPGAGTPQPQAMPQQQQLPRFKGFVILAQMPLSDVKVKDEILDLFGSEKSFQAGHAQCFTPGMGIAMTSPDKPGQPPVELLVSLSCNQAMGDGFKWPYKTNGFTPDTSQRLAKVYEKLWGAVPPNGV